MTYADSQAKQRVIAAVVQRADTLLVCQRPPEKRHGGLWEFPGGKCERGETDIDAISRELHEELAVTVTAIGEEQYRISDPGSNFLIAFLAVTIEGEPQCIEHTDVRWAPLEAIRELPLAPSDRAFVATLRLLK